MATPAPGSPLPPVFLATGNGLASTKGHLVKFAWTGITRHRMVKGGSSPDDPALAQYWAYRRRRGEAMGSRHGTGAAQAESLTHRSRDGSGETSTLRLVHVRCRDGPAPQPHRHSSSALPASPQGLLEPGARKRARPVLRGPGAATRPAYPASWWGSSRTAAAPGRQVGVRREDHDTARSPACPCSATTSTATGTTRSPRPTRPNDPTQFLRGP